MIQWNDTLTTGHAMVDNDHKQLIASLNELEVALKTGVGKQMIAEILDFLNRYTREHFAREESYMKRVGCPSYAENCKQHALLIAKLDGWLVRLQQGVAISLVLEVHREIAYWIREHIVKTDCKLRGCQNK